MQRGLADALLLWPRRMLQELPPERLPHHTLTHRHLQRAACASYAQPQRPLLCYVGADGFAMQDGKSDFVTGADASTSGDSDVMLDCGGGLSPRGKACARPDA